MHSNSGFINFFLDERKQILMFPIYMCDRLQFGKIFQLYKIIFRFNLLQPADKCFVFVFFFSVLGIILKNIKIIFMKIRTLA